MDDQCHEYKVHRLPEDLIRMDVSPPQSPEGMPAAVYLELEKLANDGELTK